jgi:hypothetical protein
MEPLLVIDDLVASDLGLTLLPAVAREGLPIVAGDSVDLCSEEGREEALVLSVDPDPRNPSLVRLRIRFTIHARRGVEVWPSESSSRVVLRTPRPSVVNGTQRVLLSGGVAPRKRAKR